MPKLQVLYYEKADGTVPVLEYLGTLKPKMEAKVASVITRLEKEGNKIREPYSKLLGDGIFELRIQLGNDASRVLYFFMDRGSAVLTHGFTKKTQKTPVGEIERAKRYRADYLRRVRRK